MTTQIRNPILEGPLWKIIVSLGLPVMLNNLFQTFYNLINTYFVGKLGTTQQAAIQFVWPLSYLILSLGAGFSVAAVSLIAQETGTGRTEGGKKYAGQAIIFSILLAVVISFLGYGLAPWIVTTMGAKDASLIQDSVTFFRISMFGNVGMFVMLTFSSIRNALGDTVLPMRINMVALLVNIALSPVFIFTFHMGIAGVAWATVIARSLFALYALWLLFSKRMDFHLNLSHVKLHKEHFLTLLKVGFPSSLGQSMEAFGFVIMNVFIYQLGKETLTAFAIGNQINSLILMPAMGMGAAITTIVGQNMGAGNILRARKGVITALWMSVSFLTLSALPLIFFAKPIIQIFTSDPLVIDKGVDYLILITISIPLMATFQAFVSAFQGSGHTGLSMLMQMSRLWVFRLPLIIILLRFTSLGSFGVWYSMVLSNFFVSIMGALIYRSGLWEKTLIALQTVE